MRRNPAREAFRATSPKRVQQASPTSLTSEVKHVGLANGSGSRDKYGVVK